MTNINHSRYSETFLNIYSSLYYVCHGLKFLHTMAVLFFLYVTFLDWISCWPQSCFSVYNLRICWAATSMTESVLFQVRASIACDPPVTYFRGTLLFKWRATVWQSHWTHSRNCNNLKWLCLLGNIFLPPSGIEWQEALMHYIPLFDLSPCLKLPHIWCTQCRDGAFFSLFISEENRFIFSLGCCQSDFHA